jgi:hypothetical protein
LFDILHLVDVETGWSAINFHSKEKFCGAKVFNVEFLLKLRLEDKRIMADDNKIINMGVDPCGWLAWLIWLMEYTRVGDSSVEANDLKKGAWTFVPDKQHFLEVVDCLAKLKYGAWRAAVAMRRQEGYCVIKRACEEGAVDV